MTNPGGISQADVDEILRKSFLKTQAFEKDLEPIVKAIFDASARHDQTPMRAAVECVYFVWQLLEAELLGEDEATVGLVRSVRDIERRRTIAEPDWLKLANEHGGVWENHPDYSFDDWRYQVANGDTRMAYWEWVWHESELHRLEHGEAPPNDTADK